MQISGNQREERCERKEINYFDWLLHGAAAQMIQLRGQIDSTNWSFGTVTVANPFRCRVVAGDDEFMHLHTHAMIGWLLAQPLSERRDRSLVMLASLIPDVDGTGLIVSVDVYERFHHTFGHSLLTGAPLALSVTIFASRRLRTLVFCGCAFATHLFADLLGSGSEWPLQLLWPVKKSEFAFPPPFQWELSSWQNLLVTFICLFWIGKLALSRGRTILETVSPTLDYQAVTALKARFAKANR